MKSCVHEEESLPDNFKLLKTNKGKSKLYHEGYLYTVETLTKPKCICRCERTGNIFIISIKTISKCYGRVATTLGHSPPVEFRRAHNHMPEPA